MVPLTAGIALTQSETQLTSQSMTTRMKTLLSLLLLAIFAGQLTAQTRPIPVKVVVLAMFEQGEDTGDTPGEYQYWVERDHLDRVIPMPAAYHAARMNDDGELAIVTGAGTAHAASTVMALGLDPRFDLSHAYWLVAGIAGGCPDRISLGSAAWARWVLDADLAYEIDAREVPKDWSTGFIPLGKSVPYEQPVQARPGQIYQLNGGLAQWAFNVSKETKLDDSDKLKQIRAGFDGAAAQKPPFVTIGDEISSSTFWHGKLLDAWASEWMRYFSEGKGEFTTTAMEDTGTLQSLVFLANAGRVDINRVMVLRTVSNFDQQPRDLTATESLARQRIGAYAAYLPSLEAAYRVGHSVVSELIGNWKKYETTIPSAAK
jgi:purine nucleoside permease